jgi:hypothetical protein
MSVDYDDIVRDSMDEEIIDIKCRDGVKMLHGQLKEIQDKVEVMNFRMIAPNRNENGAPLNELATALAKAQGEMEMAPKESSAFGNRKYADLATCIKTASPVLSKNGLSVVQKVIRVGKERLLHTMLLHSSGQYIESTIDIEIETGGQAKNNLQSLGSSLSYLRRYMYCAIVGLAQEDTDAEDIAPKQTGFVQPRVIPGVTYKN